jgi:undecaprenyl-diphosphatase
MTIIEALVLGAVQGVTEFLPVSSSGHLVLVQKIFGIQEPVLFFDTMVHVATLAAVFTVLRRDIWDILRRFFQPLTLWLVIATLPAAAAALLFKDTIEEAFVSGSFLGFAFLITAALIFLAEFLFRGSGKPGGLPAKLNGSDVPRGKDEMTWLDALIIGVLQALAIAPGISRSGSTLAGALSRRMDRDFAARFSFLLSIPAILGALVLQIRDLAKTTEAVSGIGVPELAAGTAAAAVVGFFSIRFMLKIVRERPLYGFSVYTALLGVLVLVDRFGTRFFF